MVWLIATSYEAAHKLQVERLKFALVLQGGITRLSARRNSSKKKQGFGLPFGVWAANNAKLRSLAEDSVRGLVDRNILRQDFVERIVLSPSP